jgi:hypothetical protein
MSVENWKLWLVPFAVWGLVMAWYSGYQSGYQEGHVTAWQLYHPDILVAAEATTGHAPIVEGGRLADE